MPINYAQLAREREARPTRASEDYAARVRELEAQNAATAQEMGHAGLGNERLPLWTRFRMSMGGSLQEKYNSLVKSFPNAELVMSPASGELLFREDPAQPFSKVDPGMLEDNEPLSDIVEFVGSDFGALIGETIAAFRSRGGSLLPTIGRLAAGAAAGKTSQEFLQYAQGEQEETLGEVGRDAAAAAGLSAAGSLVASPIVGLLNTTRGAGMFRTSRQGQRALRAEQELGFEAGLSIGQTIDNPLVQKMERQSAALISAFPRRFEAQRRELVERVTSASDRAELVNFPREIETAVANAQDDLLRAARRAPTTATQAGEQVQEGIEVFLRNSQNEVSAAYRAAEAIEEPIFDFSGSMPQLQAVASGQFGTPTQSSTQLIERLLGTIDTPGPLNGVPYTQRLRNIRSEAFEAGTPDPGFPVRAENRQAREIYRVIDDALKNPANTTPEFRDAWSAANNAARRRFDTIDKLVLIRASATETSEDLARRLIRPRSAERLAFARSVISPERYAQVQDAFKNELLDAGMDMRQVLNQYDDSTLSMLLTRPERDSFNVLANELQKLSDVGVQDAIRKQTRVSGFVRNVLDRSDTAAVDTLRGLVRRSGGKTSPLGKTVRAAILDLFAEKVMTRREGAMMVSPNLVNSTMKEFRDMGLFGFLELSDTRFMRNIDAIAPVIASTADSGTSIQAAEAAAGVRGGSAKAIRTVVEAFGAGRLFLNPHGRKILLGIGSKEPIDATNLRIAGAAVTQAMLLDDFQDLNPPEE